MEAKYEWNKRDKDAAMHDKAAFDAFPSSSIPRVSVKTDACYASLIPKSNDIAGKLELMGMTDPPSCFCGKPALLSETDLGPMYNCCRLASDSASGSKRICGFHVHKRAWNYFREDLLKGSDIDRDHPELSVCPYFNYTFCVLFGVVNDYPKSFPPPPRCFCGLAVKMTVEGTDDLGDPRLVDARKLVFKCHNFNIEGAKPKCAFSLSAEKIAFRRPHRILHNLDLPKMRADFEELAKNK